MYKAIAISKPRAISINIATVIAIAISLTIAIAKGKTIPKATVLGKNVCSVFLCKI